MGNAGKTTAAISAVLDYIKTKEEAIAMQAARPAMPLMVQSPAPVIKPWALSGRQAQMQLRRMMQLRAFHRR